MSIASLYPEETVAICDRALEDPETQAGFFLFYLEHDRLQDQTLALHILAEHGQNIDLPLLRKLVQSPELGRDALGAVHSLEQRLALETAGGQIRTMNIRKTECVPR